MTAEPRDRPQQSARVNATDEEWIRFRALAMQAHRSVAAYLGDLVRQEFERQRGEPAAAAMSQRPAPPRWSYSARTAR